jgi:hypothetical protein
MPLADARPFRWRTQLGAVVSLRTNGFPDCIVSSVIRTHLADLHLRVVVPAQGALLLGDFPSARIDGRGGPAFRCTDSCREVITHTLSLCYMLAGLAIANGAGVLCRLTSHRIDVPGRIVLVEIIAQRR